MGAERILKKPAFPAFFYDAVRDSANTITCCVDSVAGRNLEYQYDRRYYRRCPNCLRIRAGFVCCDGPVDTAWRAQTKTDDWNYVFHGSPNESMGLTVYSAVGIVYLRIRRLQSFFVLAWMPVFGFIPGGMLRAGLACVNTEIRIPKKLEGAVNVIENQLCSENHFLDFLDCLRSPDRNYLFSEGVRRLGFFGGALLFHPVVHS